MTSKHHLYYISTKQAITAGVIILCFYLSLIKLQSSIKESSESGRYTTAQLQQQSCASLSHQGK